MDKLVYFKGRDEMDELAFFIRDCVPPVHPTTPAVSLLVRICVCCTHCAAAKANPCKVVRHDEPEWQRPVCNLRHKHKVEHTQQEIRHLWTPLDRNWVSRARGFRLWCNVGLEAAVAGAEVTTDLPVEDEAEHAQG